MSYKPGLTKEEFIKYIEKCKHASEVYNEGYKFLYRNSDVFGDATFPMPTGYFLSLELIGKAMGLGNDDIIEYWACETEYGEGFQVGYIEDTSLDENHQYRKPDLTTVEKLYEYCLYLGELYYKKKEGD